MPQTVRLFQALLASFGCTACSGDATDERSLWAASAGQPSSTTAAPSGTGSGQATGQATGTSGLECEPTPGEFADCANLSAAVCGNNNAACLTNSTQNPAWGTCVVPCTDACECWQAPATGTAEPVCVPVLADGEQACVLSCTDGKACPDGMRCIALTAALDACVFDRETVAGTSGSTGGLTLTSGSGSLGSGPSSSG